MRHNLKLDARWFAAVEEGRKRAEIRRADRDFQVGDELLLYLRDRSRAVLVEITDILPLQEVPGCDCTEFVSLSVQVRREVSGAEVVEQELLLGDYG